MDRISDQAIMDLHSGRPMSANMAEYHIPVSADVPSLEAILVEEHERLGHVPAPVGD
jgi:xanthine dehydrogenase YagR molybdenum-binding subunit